MASTTADMPPTATETTTTRGPSDAPPDFDLSLSPVPARPTKKAKLKYITRKQSNALVIDAGEAVVAALRALEAARELAGRAGLSVDSPILGNETSAVDSNPNLVLMTTGVCNHCLGVYCFLLSIPFCLSVYLFFPLGSFKHRSYCRKNRRSPYRSNRGTETKSSATIKVHETRSSNRK